MSCFLVTVKLHQGVDALPGALLPPPQIAHNEKESPERSQPFRWSARIQAMSS